MKLGDICYYRGDEGEVFRLSEDGSSFTVKWSDGSTSTESVNNYMREGICFTQEGNSSLQRAIDLLDDTINALANYASLQKRSGDKIGAEVTKQHIKEIKDFIVNNQVTSNYYI